MNIIFDDDELLYTTMKIPFSFKDSNDNIVYPNISDVSCYIYVNATGATLTATYQYNLTTTEYEYGKYIYELELFPENIPYCDYLRVEFSDRSGSAVDKKFTVILPKSYTEEILLPTSATTVSIPFRLISDSYWYNLSGQTNNITVEYYPDGWYFDATNTPLTSAYTIEEMDNGDYDITLNLSTIESYIPTQSNSYTNNNYTLDSYLRIRLVCSGAYERRYTIRKSSVAPSSGSSSSSSTGASPSDIATAVWSAIALDSTKVDPIAAAVWSYSVSDRTITSASLSSGSLVTVSDLSGSNGGSSNNGTATVDNNAIARAVWEYTSGARSITSASLSSGSLATVADLSNSGNGNGTGTIDTGAIARAVWEYTNGARSITTASLGSGTSLATDSDIESVINALPDDYVKIEDLDGLSTFDPNYDTVTVNSLQASGFQTATGFATSSALSTLSSTVSQIKAKTDNLPSEPAAVGSAMTLTSSTVTGIQSGLATSQEVTAVRNAIPTGVATATALSAVASNVSSIRTSTDRIPASPAAVGSAMTLTSAAVESVKSGLATSEEITTLSGVVSTVKAKTDNLPSNPAAVGSEMALTSAAVTTVKNGLATSANVTSAKEAIIAEGTRAWITATGFATPTDIPEMISATDIATEVWNSTNKTAFVREVLTTDVGTLDVSNGGYTLKHLIMASQYSYVETVGNETRWVILDKRMTNEQPTIIATRVLTLNGNGAINKTE